MFKYVKRTANNEAIEAITAIYTNTTFFSNYIAYTLNYYASDTDFILKF